jgi:hypothetical protein
MRRYLRTGQQFQPLSPDDLRMLASALNDALLLANAEDAAHVYDLRRLLGRWMDLVRAGERDATKICVGALEYLEERAQVRRARLEAKARRHTLADRVQRTQVGEA